MRFLIKGIYSCGVAGREVSFNRNHRKLPDDERRVGSICGIHLGAAWQKEAQEKTHRYDLGKESVSGR